MPSKKSECRGGEEVCRRTMRVEWVLSIGGTQGACRSRGAITKELAGAGKVRSQMFVADSWCTHVCLLFCC